MDAAPSLVAVDRASAHAVDRSLFEKRSRARKRSPQPQRRVTILPVFSIGPIQEILGAVPLLISLENAISNTVPNFSKSALQRKRVSGAETTLQ
jgi:hypothetical protein